MTQEITTIQQLANLITNMDAKVDQKFEDLTELMLENFDGVDKNVDEVKDGLKKLDIRLISVEGQLEKIEFQASEKRIAVLENQMKLVSARLGLA